MGRVSQRRRLALSLAKRAQELGEAPDKSSSLYKSAIDKLVAEAGGGGAAGKLARAALEGVDLRALLPRLAARAHAASVARLRGSLWAAAASSSHRFSAKLPSFFPKNGSDARSTYPPARRTAAA